MNESERVPASSRDLDRSRVLAAKSLTPEQRVLAGFEQSEFAMKVVEAGIRSKNPAADDATVQRLLVERIVRMRRFERLAEDDP